MRKIYISSFILFLFFNAAANIPVDNPYFTKYDTCPAWTNEIHWYNVVDISNFPSAGFWDSSLIEAMNQVSLSGGGVVYFPAGTYHFQSDVDIPDGVVLRGADPLCNNAKSDSFAPPSRLIFPAYIPFFADSGQANSTAFKVIRASGDRSNLGLVYLDINRGRISIGVNGKNVIVFGVRQNNIAQPQSDIPWNYYYMHRWQRFSYRHCRNINVDVIRNTAVTNNRVNDFMNNLFNPVPDESYDQPGYIAYCRFNGPVSAPTGVTCQSGCTSSDPSCTDTTHVMDGSRTRFSYTDHYAIDVAGRYVNPDTVSLPFDQKIEINDNWVYNTMRVGIFGVGYGLVMRGNIRTDQNNKRVFLHPTGWKLNSNNAATFENRAMNFSGHHVLIENNDMRVYRHQILYTSYASVDGEGILTQESVDPYESLDDIVIRNNVVNSYIGFYKMRGIRNTYVGYNDLLDAGNIWIDANPSGESIYRLDNTVIENNVNITGIMAYGAGGTANLKILNNAAYDTGAINHHCPAVLLNNLHLRDATPCTTASSPEVVDYQPFYGEINVGAFDTVSVLWDQVVTAFDLSGITITGDSSGLVTGTLAGLAAGNRKLIISHPKLQANERYVVNIPAAAVQGTGFNQQRSWWFRVIPAPYPRILAPSDSAAGLLSDVDVFVEFIHPVTPVNLFAITITDTLLNPVAGVMAEYNPFNYTVQIAHPVLAPGWYTVSVPAGTVENSSGFQNKPIEWSFQTGNITITEILNTTAADCSVFPNPTNGFIHFKSAEKILEIQLFTLAGMPLFTIFPGSFTGRLDVSNLHTGMYIAVMIMKDKQFRVKIVRQ